MSMYRFFIQGIVQGVGFRPYIYRKATRHGLVGTVKNVGNGVEVIVDDEDFMDKLDDLPPLAKITHYAMDELDGSDGSSRIEDFQGFKILQSASAMPGDDDSAGEASLPPDIFMCDDCLKELRDRNDRRHDYYFITCTNCGPRFSMIEDYPYDRPLTSMKDFRMCETCHAEYADPNDRRYHAQTIACKDCGPRLFLRDSGHIISSSSDLETIKSAVSLIKDGEMVSIKGVGGYHICSLAEDAAVAKVRAFIHRDHKPFAVMVRSIRDAEKIAYIDDDEKEILQGPQRPIVVLKKRDLGSFKPISELDTIGIMLPYTSLHYMLFDFIDAPLLMTSCNIPGEPMAITDAITRYSLTHERKIVNRCDDSVIRIVSGNKFYLRRSRGFVPLPIPLPINAGHTLALGAELNNVICAAKGTECFPSQYIGNTAKLATYKFLEESALRLIRLTRLNPKIIACDLHPSYNSTLLAKRLSEQYYADLIQVQHHKAHVASVAAEHGLKDYIGIAVDGLGYGDDGNIWGGEIFKVHNGVDFKRIGHLEEQPQLGGDSATINPKKMLFGILSRSMDEDELLRLGLFDEKESRAYINMLEGQFNVPMTTSTGRILDAASALLGLCDKRTYDGRPAMLLESHATRPLDLEPVIKNIDGKDILMTSGLMRFLLDNRKEHTVGELAATAQMYIAQGLYEIASEHSYGLPIVMSGGVSYNGMISSYMLKNDVLFNKQLPSGDGGICYGQAYLANCGGVK